MSSQQQQTVLRSSIALALSPTTPEANLTGKLRRKNQKYVGAQRDVENGHRCAANLKTKRDEIAPILAQAEQDDVDGIIEWAARDLSGPCPADVAQEPRAEHARITSVIHQLENCIIPKRERLAMLAQADVLEARAVIIEDTVGERENRQALLMAPLLMLEGTVELSDKDSTSAKLREARGSLLIAAAELRERVRDLDARAALGVSTASGYDPNLLQQFSDRFKALFSVTAA